MNNEDFRENGRCSTRCDHDSQCLLFAGHGDRHETDHGCICYDPRRYGPFARENRKDDDPWRDVPQDVDPGRALSGDHLHPDVTRDGGDTR